jgi:hypothetical protein
LLRTTTQGEYVSPGGAFTHRPGNHDHRPRRSVHSPSIHTALGSFGRRGIVSTRAGGMGKRSSASALVGCPE